MLLDSHYPTIHELLPVASLYSDRNGRFHTSAPGDRASDTRWLGDEVVPTGDLDLVTKEETLLSEV
jgi:hypothetical protein